MFKIQTLNKISSKGLDLLPRDQYETASEFSNPDAYVLRSFKMHDMEFGDNVKGIARAGAGVNNIPLDKCSEKGIVVFNTPGANANSVKELVIASLFLSSRRINQGINWTQSLLGKGDEVPKLVEGGKKDFVGPEILGKKLGVVGLGAIGVMVANAAASLGMEVIGYDPFISVEAAWGLSSSVKRADSVDALLAESDYMSLHVPLNDATKGMLNKEKFAITKKGIRIMNFARGGLVNNEDLLGAIEDGIVACYVTDFPDETVLNNDKIVTIPHLGASTPEAEENCAIMAAKQLKEFLETGNIVNSVNYPNCSMAMSGDTRILITNKNVPNMVGQITTVLANAKINISELLNKHRGDYAYNIIDVDGDVSDDIIAQLAAIEGVIKVRTIKA